MCVGGRRGAGAGGSVGRRGGVEEQLCHYSFAILSVVINSTKNDFAPLGANSFLLRVDPI